MARWSISRRLVATLSGGLVALWLLAVGVSALVVRHEINQVFDSALQETAQRLLPLAIDDLQTTMEDEEDRTIEEATEIAIHDEYLTYQVRDADGRVLLRSHDASIDPFPVPLETGYAQYGDRRFYTESALRGDIFIQVAEPLAYRTEAIIENLAWLAAPLLLLVPLAGLDHPVDGARYVAPDRRPCARPYASAAAPIWRRSTRRDCREELSPIIHDVNRLLERLHQAMEAERSLAANSAHELRTPVAAALAQTQRLGAELAAAPAARARRAHCCITAPSRQAGREAAPALPRRVRHCARPRARRPDAGPASGGRRVRPKLRRRRPHHVR